MTMVGRIFVVVLLIAVVAAEQPERQQRVLRGRNAKPGEFPYQVSLVLKGNHHLCGGSIITSRHILTAAHCLVGMIKPPYNQNLTILTGATNWKTEGQHHRVLKGTPHEDYEFGTRARWRNDIAVITLEDEIKFSDVQSPIALPKTPTPGDVMGILTGWGYPGMNSKVMDILQTRTVTILTNEKCNAKNVDIREKQLCGFDGHATGFCTGDSGGPLVYNNEVVGIVSFAAACGIGAPDVYTRVHSYLDFINSVISSD